MSLSLFTDALLSLFLHAARELEIEKEKERVREIERLKRRRSDTHNGDDDDDDDDGSDAENTTILTQFILSVTLFAKALRTDEMRQVKSFRAHAADRLLVYRTVKKMLCDVHCVPIDPSAAAMTVLDGSLNSSHSLTVAMVHQRRTLSHIVYLVDKLMLMLVLSDYGTDLAREMDEYEREKIENHRNDNRNEEEEGEREEREGESERESEGEGEQRITPRKRRSSHTSTSREGERESWRETVKTELREEMHILNLAITAVSVSLSHETCASSVRSRSAFVRLFGPQSLRVHWVSSLSLMSKRMRNLFFAEVVRGHHSLPLSLSSSSTATASTGYTSTGSNPATIVPGTGEGVIGASGGIEIALRLLLLCAEYSQCASDVKRLLKALIAVTHTLLSSSSSSTTILLPSYVLIAAKKSFVNMILPRVSRRLGHIPRVQSLVSVLASLLRDV